MANNCAYNMKVVGNRKEDVDEFLSMMDYSHPEGKFFARIFEAYPYNFKEENGKYAMFIAGDCAWSVYSCMCGGIFTYYTDNQKNDNQITNLAIETKRLNLKVEIYSQEPGVGFAEHIIYDNGECVEMEETDFEEYWDLDNMTIEEFEQEHGITLSMEQIYTLETDGYIAIGGYDEVFTI